MSREKYYEKVEMVRYSCHSCSLPLSADFEANESRRRHSIILDGERLDFHNGCLFEHLKETWIPYKD